MQLAGEECACEFGFEYSEIEHEIPDRRRG
jgi:hypothetical protein